MNEIAAVVDDEGRVEDVPRQPAVHLEARSGHVHLVLQGEVLQQLHFRAGIAYRQTLQRNRRAVAVSALAVHEEFGHHHQLDGGIGRQPSGKPQRAQGIAAAQFVHVVVALNDLAHRLREDHVVLFDSVVPSRSGILRQPPLAFGDPCLAAPGRAGQRFRAPLDQPPVAVRIQVGPQMQRLDGEDFVAPAPEPLDIEIGQQQISLAGRMRCGAAEIDQAGTARPVGRAAHSPGDGHEGRVLPGAGPAGVAARLEQVIAHLGHRVEDDFGAGPGDRARQVREQDVLARQYAHLADAGGGRLELGGLPRGGRGILAEPGHQVRGNLGRREQRFPLRRQQKAHGPDPVVALHAGRPGQHDALGGGDVAQRGQQRVLPGRVVGRNRMRQQHKRLRFGVELAAPHQLHGAFDLRRERLGVRSAPGPLRNDQHVCTPD